MKLLTIFILSIAVVLNATAAELSLTKGMVTRHLQTKGLNEDNHFTGIDLTAGVGYGIHYAEFNNSFGVWSNAIGVHYGVHYGVIGRYVSSTLRGGAVKGYEPEFYKEVFPCIGKTKWCLYVAPSFSFDLVTASNDIFDSNIPENIKFGPDLTIFGEAFLGSMKLSVEF